MDIFQAIIIAIVEGITEFLPVSSTGHMIITQKLLGIESNSFVKLFTVNIQFGAILSVIILYWKRFFQTFDFYLKLFIAFLPAAFLGFLFSGYIDQMLESVLVVAVSLVLGGVFLLFIDSWFNNPSENQKITSKKALVIGFFQVIAMIPGVSRSAATIIGGLTQKLNRKNATEFSFFLAVPTMFAASAYEMIKSYKSIQPEHINVLLIGNLVAFLVAILAIKGFITFLTKHGFKVFGYYRIIVGAIILILLAAGIDLNIA
ncbi:MAG: undecaprenyl-diphosphate phosphatase [Bacteroidales bacterium]|nr:undecaprenyl-diphosphate phosphatase [Bacteroidales bacterium]